MFAQKYGVLFSYPLPYVLSCEDDLVYLYSPGKYLLIFIVLRQFIFTFMILPPFLDVRRIVFWEKIQNIRYITIFRQFYHSKDELNPSTERFDGLFIICGCREHLSPWFSECEMIPPSTKFSFLNIRARKLYTLHSGTEGV